MRPRLVALGQGATLFPLPVRAMKAILDQVTGLLYFDGAHQAGLIAGGVYPNPLDQGADVFTGSGGKTLSGPQSGMICWNDSALTSGVMKTIFPGLSASHQINRVAALAAASAEFLEFGSAYMRQTVANAQALAKALADRGFTVLGEQRGFTQTHQVLLDTRSFGAGQPAARRLEQGNVIVSQIALPSDSARPSAPPGGIRIGTVEITRLGMFGEHMPEIADYFHRLLIKGEPPERVRRDVIEFRSAFQNLYYCFDGGLPLPPG